jgi:DNA-binding MarR family transcriptional regulator
MLNSRKKPAGAGLPQFSVGGEVREPAQLKSHVGYAIRRAQLRAYESFYAALAELETTPARFTLMLLIRENPGIRSVDLARTLNVARSGMVRLVDELARSEWVVRETLVDDRRNQGLTLTAEGRRRLSQLERAVERHEAQLTKGLNAAERKRLLDLLWRVGA